MEKELKFNVGDKVRVKSIEWYDAQQKDKDGDICTSDDFFFAKNMKESCGKVLTIIEKHENSYGVNNSRYWWQDWMLEDEVVTEEEQEAEQLNKNTMETKKMTLKEAQNYVKKTKYIIWSEDESRKLQKKLFEIGCKWKIDGQIVSHAEHPFLFVDNNLEITFVHKEACMYFDGSTYFCMLVDDIINIELEQEPKEAPKPKFDPNTLQPFDKVLVRNAEEYQWKCTFFSHINKGTNCLYKCVSCNWEYCIPYNDETKHLVGTTDEAPEFYRLD